MFKIFRELYAAVPGIRKSLLGVHAKRFGEQFHHLQRRLSLSRAGSVSSLASSTDSIYSRSSHSSPDGRESRSDSQRLYLFIIYITVVLILT